MPTAPSILLLPYLAVSIILTIAAVITFERSTVRGARATGSMIVAILLWQYGYILELISPDLSQKLFWDRFQWIPMFAVSLSSLALGLIFNQISLRWLWGASVLPLLFMGLLYMEAPGTGLIYTQPEIIVYPPFNILDYPYTPLMLAVFIYAYGLVIVALALLAYRYRHSHGRERLRVGIIFIGIMIGEVLSIALILFDIEILGQRDTSPVTTVLGVLVIAWGVMRYRVFDPMPVAQHSLLEKISDAVVIVDANDRIVGMNQTARIWAGQIQDGCEGRFLYDVFPTWKSRVDANNGQELDTYIRWMFRDHERTLNLRAAPLQNGRGRMVGKLLLVRDITQTTELLQRLRHSEQRQRIISDHAYDMIAVIRPDGVLQYTNPAFQTVLGYTREELYMQPGFKFIYPDDRTVMMQALTQFINAAKKHPFVRFRALRADGEFLWLEAAGSVVMNKDGGIDAIVAIFRDISDRLEKERLKGALEKQAELNEQRRRMMIRIAHEFRTPLSIMQTSLYLLEQTRRELPPEKRTLKFNEIREQIQIIAKMLDSISDVVNDRLIPSEQTRQPVDLRQTCVDVFTDLREQHATGHHLTLPDAPFMVQVASNICEIALQQTLDNAIRFSPPDSTIRVRFAYEADTASIQIMDEGPGILSDERSLIFEPFYRGKNIDESRGLGLGLTIAQAAMTAQGGQLILRETGEVAGATFELRLPRTPDE